MSGDGFFVSSRGFDDLIDKSLFAMTSAMVAGVQESVDDLARISSNIAPIDTSTLRQSVEANVKIAKYGVIGTVSFSAVEISDGYGPYDYALWTHEADYKLGPTSAQSPGTDGYSVGNKYLERPLKGESNKYLGMMAAAVKGAIG